MLGRFDARFDTRFDSTFALMLLASTTMLARMLARLDSPVFACIVLGYLITWMLGRFDARIDTFACFDPMPARFEDIVLGRFYYWLVDRFEDARLDFCSLGCSLNNTLVTWLIGRSVATMLAWMFHSL